MKKLLFCAVALTAFSFSTMANNEVKEEKEVVNLETTKTDDPCIDWACDMLDLVEAMSGCEYTPLEQGNMLLAFTKICDEM